MLILPTGPSKKNRSSGFTLIELLIVILIVGLFSALLSIRVEGVLSGGDLRLASRMIIGEINKLRGKAAYTHKDQILGLNMDENSLYSIEPKPDGQKSSEWLTDEKETAPKAMVLPAGVELEDVVILSTGKVQEGEAKALVKDLIEKMGKPAKKEAAPAEKPKEEKPAEAPKEKPKEAKPAEAPKEKAVKPKEEKPKAEKK